MRMVDIIKKKRDGGVLSRREIEFFVQGYTKGVIPDYQAAAWLMAVYYQGMTKQETAYLTYAIRDSGEVVDLSDIEGVKVDKHSSGGVGDKTTLVVAPIVAACGVKVAKMSGRGLGHTGGTVDKLESIPGFCTVVDRQRFFDIVRQCGVSLIGQSGNLAPADKKLYALRDVTATVDSLPLIVSSIMGKKLAAGADAIVLDVKTGSGSFLKSQQGAVDLAQQMVHIGKKAGKRVVALITNMDVPLGNAIGNSLEVIEAVHTLRGEGPQDFTELCLQLAANMLYLADKGSLDSCRDLAQTAIWSGKALQAFADMVTAQGGDARYIYDTSLFATARHCVDVLCPADGYITQVNTEQYGLAAQLLGAGRATKEDAIDHAAGIVLHRKTGDKVCKGEVLATLHTNKEAAIAEATRLLLSATFIGQQAPMVWPIVLQRVQ